MALHLMTYGGSFNFPHLQWKICAEDSGKLFDYIPSNLVDRHTLPWYGGRSPHSGTGTAVHTGLHGCLEDKALHSFVGNGVGRQAEPKMKHRNNLYQETTSRQSLIAPLQQPFTQIIQHCKFQLTVSMGKMLLSDIYGSKQCCFYF